MFKYLLIFVSIVALVSFSGCFDVDRGVKAKVVKVSDGDTIKLLINKKIVTVRLAGIDAPELKQDYGKQAKQALSDLVLDATVSAKIIDSDKYGRTVAVLYAGNRSINLQMVQIGAAWFYRDYSGWMDAGTIKQHERAEALAKRKKMGLWNGRPVAPWSYRKKAR